MIKAVFFDIDGTLVSFNTHVIPPSTLEALDLLRKKGIMLFIATGRHRAYINNLGDQEFDGYITLNGGYCVAGESELIYKHSIPSTDIDALIEYQKAYPSNVFPYILVKEKELFMNYKTSRVETVLSQLNFPEPPVVPYSEIPPGDVYQIIAFFDADQEKHVMPFLPGSESTRWSPLFTDVVPKGSSKQVGIDKIIEHYGFTLNETMAFGDGGNDIQMLRHAGTGIAMGNAEDAVKQAADYVTASVDDDGIYKALKYFKII
ncbi:Cof subfamily protein (haloacid dehalogenase superfamily) [Parabacteroides sp. PF5-5]|uniref:Cof-type HAD-IIB family hydrolase n=1 Tax=unclassified Parabacteroides TaxID=2649774 RepID=UPI002476E715|nr:MULTISPECIES: Cof-type HAD-IIB family hydrolase [unclassified Parabacteroides]MDH6306942.1 Cof subfamily protein (haloacid dehalogenase superfamily) [Parabacteroides sp. PH5-39]MDH6317797.1 Cof subfamily protein (haloacid dehalogenase superfamily) [Parabacteroides sp. PF5-13]MDH6321547.1 Cof subfamily protein (haloacid dehalogenase superfamily) [Parabacteroides sp. PH5-13]MDH6325329.1 Cof subfamily protein (haloacid dehalogenase superfamily) [Parabacteroides sp. PH5-8]MDH6329000.1 Cof subfa